MAVAAPPGREVGATRLFWRAEADTDPVLAPLATGDDPVRCVTSMHGDAIVELPSGAVWLASSNMYPYQAFRLGSALGVQFHPEASRAGFAAWCAGYDDVDTAAALAGFDEHAPRCSTAGAGSRSRSSPRSGQPTTRPRLTRAEVTSRSRGRPGWSSRNRSRA